MRSLGALTPAALAMLLFACGDPATPADGGADHAGHLPADLAQGPADLAVSLDLTVPRDLASPPDLAALFCANCHANQANAVMAGKHKSIKGDCLACHKDGDKHQWDPGKVKATMEFSIEGCAATCHADYVKSQLMDDGTKPGKYGGSIKTSKYIDFPKYQHLMGGHGFTIEYNEERAHAYLLKDHREIKRKQNTVCLQCKSTPVTLYWNESRRGQPVFGKDQEWAAVVQKLTTDYGKTLDYGAGCNHCHDPHSGDFRIIRKAMINAILERGTDPYSADFNVYPKTPAELMGKMNERDGQGKLTPAARRLAGMLTCAQCHIEYVCGPGIDKDKGIIRDEVPWRKARDIEAYYKVKFNSLQDWTHSGTGLPGIKPQHPETEFYWESKHYKEGLSCADCHMGKSNNQSSHWFTSPLKLGRQMCERCHVNDAAARLQRVITVQDTVMNRAKTVENNLDAVLTKIEALKADPNFDQAKLLQAKEAFMRGLFFWEWTVVSENSSGFHNSDEAAANLQAAEAEIAKAKPLLGL